jgi:GGDEF domain-containing protein
MNESQDGYGLLARLRELERELRRLRGDWRSFRDHPSPRTLSDLRRQTSTFAVGLDSLLEEAARPSTERPPVASSPAAPRRDRPAPRDVVRASREIDALIWATTSGWREALAGREEEHLSSMADALQRSAERCATLIVALGGTVTRSGGTWGGVARQADPTEGSIEDLATELEGMLWKVQADWQYLRGGPTPDRLHLLMDSLESAASTTTALLDLGRRAGGARFRRALRIGRQLNEGVRFLPYRDPFTGAYNREGFDALAEAELKRCRRYGRPFGLLALEISPPNLPGMKRLVATARAELREYDLVARYVDDLILVGVPEGGAGPTRRVASRLLRALRAEDMSGWFRRLSYAASPEDGSTLGGLVRSVRERLQA